MKNLKVAFVAVLSLVGIYSCNDERDQFEEENKKLSIHEKLAFHDINTSSLDKERESGFLALGTDDKFIFFTSRDTLYGTYKTNRDSLNILGSDIYKKIKFTDVHTKNKTAIDPRDQMFIEMLELSDSYTYFLDPKSEGYILKTFPAKGTIIIGKGDPETFSIYTFGSKRKQK